MAANTNVDVALKSETSDYNITRTVTTDASGNVTFAAGIFGGAGLDLLSLTVGGNAITLPTKDAEVGKIYNITRSAAPAPSYTMGAAATTSDKGKLICTAGHIHVYGEDAACTAGRVAKIIYVGTNGHAIYNHGLALALTDENGGSTMNWSAAGSACSNKNTSIPVTGATWLLASQDQWNTMITAFGGYGDLRDGFSSIGGTNLQTTYRYWSSSDSGDLGYRCSFYDGSWGLSDKGNSNYARAALAF